jgi:hypothetical protein
MEKLSILSEGEYMPISEISLSCEGKDQKSDQSPKDVSRSNGRVRDFATRLETYQHAALNDLQQRGVEEQAYEQEQARKGKMLAITDDTSLHSDTSSSSGSDSQRVSASHSSRESGSQVEEHAAESGDLDESLRRLGETLMIAGEATPAGNPAKGAFHDPTTLPPDAVFWFWMFAIVFSSHHVLV